MLIRRMSPLTKQWNTMDLPVTEAQLEVFYGPDRPYIQDVFPDLTPEQREFINTGYTQADWDRMFPEEDDES